MHELKGVHVFAEGTWNGHEITSAILDSLVNSFAATASAGKVPLKFGHDDSQPITDGQPAIGWVTRVWREGAQLLADFAGIPGVVFDAIREGLYKFVSIELLTDVEWNGSKWPAVLDAIALLGADRPAVKTLKDLQSLTMSQQIPSMRVGARAAFTQALPTINHGERKAMSDDNKPDVNAIVAAAIAPVTGELKSLREQFTAQSATLKAAQDENTALKAKADEAAKQARSERIAANKERFTAIANAQVTAGKLTPAKRDKFMAKHLKNEEAYADLDFEDVELAFGKPEETRERQRPTSFSRASATDSNEEAINIDRRKAVREYQSAHPQADSFTANAAVMRLNPDLAREFKALVFGQPN